MQRVLIIGAGGSGKSTLARRLSGRTGLPLIHLDALYWRPGWQPTPADEWQQQVQQLVRGDRWIIDGNYGGTLNVRLAACDTVIFLDVPRVVCLWRVLKRWAHHRRGRQRPDIAPGCPEQLNWQFLKWIWTYPEHRRDDLLRRLQKLHNKRVVVLRSRAELESFLNEY